MVDAENEVASSGKRLDRHLVPDTPAKESLGPILNDHHRVAAARLVPDWINKIPIKGHVFSVEPIQPPYAPERKVRELGVWTNYLFVLAGGYLGHPEKIGKERC